MGLLSCSQCFQHPSFSKLLPLRTVAREEAGDAAELCS